MAKKKLFTKKELETLSAETIIDKIQHENYSLLNSIGAEKLRKEMVPIGKACHVILNMFYAGKNYRNITPENLAKVRKNITKVLHAVAPAKYDQKKFTASSKNGLVIGFNHPSLGEILRLVALKVEVFGEKDMLFPVNLPWYEALANDYDRLKTIGIIITPTITPSTWTKMNLKEGTKLFECASNIKRDFRHIYTNRSHETVKNGGVIFVAPSATRQSTVFKTPAVYNKEEDIIPTMSILALKLYTDPDMKCGFLPVSILPPNNYKRGLSLKKTYELIPSKEWTATEIRKKYFKTKNPKRLENFDYDFHLAIAKNLPKNFWY